MLVKCSDKLTIAGAIQSTDTREVRLARVQIEVARFAIRSARAV